MAETLKTAVIGEEIPTLTRKAYAHIDPQARNPIHTDDFAREHGMRGALVGGSIMLGYVLEALYGYFGEKWLSHGKIKVSYIGGGMVNGDTVVTHGIVKSVEKEAMGDRVTLEVWLDNQTTGNKTVVGEASCIL